MITMKTDVFVLPADGNFQAGGFGFRFGASGVASASGRLGFRFQDLECCSCGSCFGYGKAAATRQRDVVSRLYSIASAL